MDPKRKEIVIKEIQHWKRSNLLPEHYCDFLLTLYTEGEEDIDDDRQRNVPIVRSIMVMALFVLATLVIYFTDFPLGMQITIGIFFTMAILLVARKTLKESRLITFLYLLFASFILFLLTIEVVVKMFDESSRYVILAVLTHCLLWIIVGLKWRIWFFSIAGVLGLVILMFVYYV